MSKTLVLVRHGKSSWDHPNLKDFDRPLKSRATKDAMLVSEAFKKVNTKQFYAFSSGANRAITTAKMLTKQLGANIIMLKEHQDLYTFSPSDLLQIIKLSSNDINNLMLFGHNPAITDIANQLGNHFFENVPTTGLVEINFEIDTWDQINNGQTRLHLFPKKLK